MPDQKSSVDVIVPTMGRETLYRALLSLRAQTVDMQAIVVLDNPEKVNYVRSILSKKDKLLITKGHEGGARARNIGLNSSIADYLAYLDDDDWWESEKLEVQLRKMEDQQSTICFAYSIFHEISGKTRILPQKNYSLDIKVADYMVLRPTLRHGYGYMQSSSLMINRSVLGKVRWDGDLPKHQDWDYVLRLSQHPCAKISFVDIPVVHVQQGSSESISKNRSWKSSNIWFVKHREQLSELGRGDFVATQILRSSLAAMDFNGIKYSIGQLISSRVHFSAIVVGLFGIYEAIQRLIHKILWR